jgi:hypothetical protein
MGSGCGYVAFLLCFFFHAINRLTQPKEEPKVEPAAEEKSALGFDFRKLFEAVRFFLLYFTPIFRHVLFGRHLPRSGPACGSRLRGEEALTSHHLTSHCITSHPITLHHMTAHPYYNT